MKEININGQEKFLKSFADIFSIEKTAQYIYENKLGLVIILSHMKAKEWPRKNRKLNNNPIEEIPFLWAIVYAKNKDNLDIIYDIYPGKCLPLKYNQDNNNSDKKELPIEQDKWGTLGGCARYIVEVNGYKYSIYEKIPLYCPIFGLPNDCYSPNFMSDMNDKLEEFKDYDLWCFENTDFISNKVLPNINLKFMKGELLPSKFFTFVQSSSEFLRGLFKIKELNALNSEPWYSHCYELINEFNPFESEDYFRYEEKAFYFIEKKLIFESIRLILLISNSEKLEKYNIISKEEDLNLANLEEYMYDINNMIEDIIRETKELLKNFIDKNKHLFDFDRFMKSRFLILDVEFSHVSYPVGDATRNFNFPSIITNIVWRGIRKGFEIDIQIFNLPCHFCEEKCRDFNKKFIKFDCLNFDINFYQNQMELFNEYLALYDGLKLYSYGKSDFFQLEQLTNFFTDSYEIYEFHRKNRIKTYRLSKIAEDLAIEGTSLNEIEEKIIKKQFPSWSRTRIKERINKRFMTKYKTPKWGENYRNILFACMDDTVSTLIYLICRDFT